MRAHSRGNRRRPMAVNLESDTIGSRLAAAARGMPNRPAATAGDAAMSFAELDAAASRIAGRVSAVVPERPGLVGLLFDAKLPALPAIAGAARSGRAYVPLDAS